ncbi:MAG: hypothetical protein IPM38_11670 [Ignavibacteria bacterium]|nr:hypothetical protein [Ignavibacteria bacterium]
MNKCFSAVISVLFISIIFISCGNNSPENYFNIAVLNTNRLSGFAGNGMIRQLESPSEMKTGENNETAAMKSVDAVNSHIEFIETNLSKLKELKPTEDTKEMLDASLALHEYVLPVFKNEYMQLAGLYDSRASEDKISALSGSIKDRYLRGYEDIYNKLIAAGKQYAEKNTGN